MRRRQMLKGAAAAVLAAPAVAGAAEEDLTAVAPKAWLFCLPLIEMAAARSRMTDPASVGQHAGVNRFSHARALVGPDDRMITTPNNDTLYSSAFIDLTRGPLRLTVPDAGRRYFSVAVMDMYTANAVVLGARTPGGAAGPWRLLAPGAKAEGPRDIVVPTPHAWVLGRTLTSGAGDLLEAHSVQDGLVLEGPSAPEPAPYARRSDGALPFFASAADLINSDPPLDKAGFDAFQRLRAATRAGVFEPGAFATDTLARIEAALSRTSAFIETAGGQVRFDQGWSYPRPSLGLYGADYAYRAAVSVAGLGALPVREAMYLRAQAPGGDHRFSGDGEFLFRLPGQIPVDGFWSLTMYEITADGQFYLTHNRLNRYAIGDRTPGLRRGPNGSLEIRIGRRDPGGELSSNWLPAPERGDYAMTLRCYLPRQELLSGAYRAPSIVRV